MPKSHFPSRFVPYPTWVATHPNLGCVDKNVYLALLLYADNTTRTCWPSQTTIGAHCGLSRKSVNHSLKRLELNGCIVTSKKNGKVNVYYLPPEPPQVMGIDNLDAKFHIDRDVWPGERMGK